MMTLPDEESDTDEDIAEWRGAGSYTEDEPDEKVRHEEAVLADALFDNEDLPQTRKPVVEIPSTSMI